jgi:hypothetical protein
MAIEQVKRLIERCHKRSECGVSDYWYVTRCVAPAAPRALAGSQGRVGAARGDPIVVDTPRDDPAVLEVEDQIGFTHRAEPMGDDHASGRLAGSARRSSRWRRRGCWSPDRAAARLAGALAQGALASRLSITEMTDQAYRLHGGPAGATLRAAEAPMPYDDSGHG